MGLLKGVILGNQRKSPELVHVGPVPFLMETLYMANVDNRCWYSLDHSTHLDSCWYGA